MGARFLSNDETMHVRAIAEQVDSMAEQWMNES